MRYVQRGMIPKLLVLASLALVACGSPFSAGELIPPLHQEGGADALDPPDVVLPGLDAAPDRRGIHVHHDGGAETSADVAPGSDAMPDVVHPDAGKDTSPPLDAMGDAKPPPPDTSPVDTGCAPPGLPSTKCDTLIVSVPPGQFCSYDLASMSYSVGSTPAECQCASTYNCTCLSWYLGAVCAGKTYVMCVMSGGYPLVTCD
jgi:hypothetical protein